jgi:hypothetical protein
LNPNPLQSIGICRIRGRIIGSPWAYPLN